MKAEEKPCTRKELLATMLGGLAEAGVSVVAGYTEPFREAARSVRPASRPAVMAQGALRPAFLIRPPGAATEDRFLELCSRCGACVKACPALVLRKAGPEFSGLEGSPILRPAKAPCLFCEGLPCAAACKTGALVQPAPGGRARIGLAAVDAALCYAGPGQPCDLCLKKCPVGPAAISVKPGSPALANPAACNGCGLCAQVCPAGAITIEGFR